MKTALKTWSKRALYVLYLLVAVTLLFECCYRFYLFDFYANENTLLNKNVPAKAKKHVLVFGDSFSADPQGWVGLLRDSLKDAAVYNAAIPGSGIREARLEAGTRISEDAPQHIIVQVYVGNDFTDIRHPSGSSFFRGTWWWLSDRLIGLRYINYKLRGLKRGSEDAYPKQDEQFDAARYDRHQRQLIDAAPDYLLQTFTMKGREGENVRSWWESFDKLRLEAKPGTTFSVVLVPQCAQVSARYAANMKKLGALLPSGETGDALHHFFAAEAEKRGVEFINPLLVFQSAEAHDSTLYYPNDEHLNRTGQVLLGVTVLRALDK